MKYLKIILDFIKRNFMTTVLTVLAINLMVWSKAEFQTVLYILVIESLAIALSGIALYAYTTINFTEKLLKGDDLIVSEGEQRGLYYVIGAIFLAVHILVGLVVLGVYIAQFSN